MSQHVRIEERDFAFQNRIQTFSIVNQDIFDLDQFFREAYREFETRITTILNEHFIVKIGFCFVGEFEKVVVSENGEVIEPERIYLNINAEVVDFETDLESFFTEVAEIGTSNKMHEMQLRGSGFSLTEIIELNIQVSQFDPIVGSSYIPLPQELQAKRAIINVKNNDNKCFMYAIFRKQ